MHSCFPNDFFCPYLLSQHRAKAHSEFVASNAGVGAPIPNADSAPAVSSDGGGTHGAANVWGEGIVDGPSAGGESRTSRTGVDAHGATKIMVGSKAMEPVSDAMLNEATDISSCPAI